MMDFVTFGSGYSSLSENARLIIQIEKIKIFGFARVFRHLNRIYQYQQNRTGKIRDNLEDDVLKFMSTMLKAFSDINNNEYKLINEDSVFSLTEVKFVKKSKSNLKNFMKWKSRAEMVEPYSEKILMIVKKAIGEIFEELSKANDDAMNKELDAVEQKSKSARKKMTIIDESDNDENTITKIPTQKRKKSADSTGNISIKTITSEMMENNDDIDMSDIIASPTEKRIAKKVKKAAGESVGDYQVIQWKTEKATAFQFVLSPEPEVVLRYLVEFYNIKNGNIEMNIGNAIFLQSLPLYANASMTFSYEQIIFNVIDGKIVAYKRYDNSKIVDSLITENAKLERLVNGYKIDNLEVIINAKGLAILKKKKKDSKVESDQKKFSFVPNKLYWF